MKHALLISLLALMAGAAFSQDRIYRCGNEYTNNPGAAKTKDCKLVEGGNVTVVPGTKPANGTAGLVTAPANTPKVDNGEQKSRDADARAILESELRKAEANLAALQQEYNNGEPEKMGSEARNYQKYLDRVASLKDAIARAEADIAGIKRELSRMK
jgi:hypothetical protein